MPEAHPTAEQIITQLRDALEKAMPFIGYSMHVPEIQKQTDDAFEAANAYLARPAKPMRNA